MNPTWSAEDSRSPPWIGFTIANRLLGKGRIVRPISPWAGGPRPAKGKHGECDRNVRGKEGL